MKCYDSEILSRYQDGALSEAATREVSEHLMGCLFCQERLRELGRSGLFYRISLSSRKNAECLDAEQLGAYLSGEMSLESRRQVEGHLVTCPRCLHEVASLSDDEMLVRTSASPVPTRQAMARFRRMAAPARRPIFVGRPAVTWALRVAAVLMLTLALYGTLNTPAPSVPMVSANAPEPIAVAAATPVAPGAPAVAEVKPASEPTHVLLVGNGSVLEPDASDLAHFARETGLILAEIARIGKHPQREQFELVKEDILSTGIVDSLSRLREQTTDPKDRQFLTDCEYLLMRIVKADSNDLGTTLMNLTGEIRRLDLIEAARLVEMERGASQWLAEL